MCLFSLITCPRDRQKVEHTSHVDSDWVKPLVKDSMVCQISHVTRQICNDFMTIVNNCQEEESWNWRTPKPNATNQHILFDMVELVELPTVVLQVPGTVDGFKPFDDHT